MNCRHVTKHHIVDRYVLNQLMPEEAERFEDHYMTCDACLDEIDRAELMARGFKRMGAEEIAATSALAASVAWWRRQRTWMGAAALAGLVALAAPLWLDLDRSATLGAAGAQANTPVIYLQPERSVAAAPSRQLQRSSGPGPVVLVFELSPPHYPSYRAVVEHAGRRVVEIQGLELGERSSVTLSLSSGLLVPGDHRVRLYSTGADGPKVAVASFAFRVLD